MLAVWFARPAAARLLRAALPEEEQQAAPVGAAAEPHTVAGDIVAAADIAAAAPVADIAGAHIAAEVALEPRTAAEAAVGEVAPVVAARPPAPGERRRIQAVVVAREPPVFRVRRAQAAEALQPQKPPLPAPVPRRMGSLSSKGEHRVRIADISS